MAIKTIIKLKQISASNTADITSRNIECKIINNKSIYLIHRATIRQLCTKRQGTANTKTKSEVQGGGRKPWKQKGTGKARAGSIRSPLWRGGGVTFGPKDKIYDYKINAKEKKLAVCTLLHNKASQISIIPNNEFFSEKPSTQLLLNKIKLLDLNINEKLLIIVKNKDKNLYLSSRNIPNIELIQANQINIVALLKAKLILITLESLEEIQGVYND
uniref:Large ribosomal subunit protein uL4c n=1 Tax=Kumanoa americana TaxID=1196377 RepID=A0A1C9CGX9_9FLOR|nr:ribosomal protein L4 [Kumanoa americana]AOM67631.1 ribosomal protein L4 [Kumanoa americana]